MCCQCVPDFDLYQSLRYYGLVEFFSSRFAVFVMVYSECFGDIEKLWVPATSTGEEGELGQMCMIRAGGVGGGVRPPAYAGGGGWVSAVSVQINTIKHEIDLR